MKTKKAFFLPPPPTNDDSSNPPDARKRLPTSLRLAYSMGHVFNDLCASLWFSYFLLFLNSVLRFRSTTAGILLLIGQVVDALATPLVGLESDRRRSLLSVLCCGYGKRKSWHLFGTILVVISFPFLFQESFLNCPPAENGHWTTFLYYAVLISVFQIGWASVQVSHVALITDLSPYPKERVTLNVYRHMATVTSNICVYGIAWLVLHSGSDENDDYRVGPSSTPYFRTIVLSVGAIGVTCSVVFHLLVREGDQTRTAPTSEVYGQYKMSAQPQTDPNFLEAGGQTLQLRTKLDNEKAETEKPQQMSVFAIQPPEEAKKPPLVMSDNPFPEVIDARKTQLAWRQWLTKFSFYQVALLYVASRLYVNTSQVYMALYLQYTLSLPKETLAIVPLVVNVSGLLFAFLLKPISLRIGNKGALVVGCVIGAAACLWVHLFVPNRLEGTEGTYVDGGWQVYAVGALYGLGGTTLLVASLAITADLIGTNTRSSAFVFGVMSLFDKLASGGAILLVQYLDPIKNSSVKLSNTPFYRQVLVIGCGAAVLVTVLGLLTTLPGLLNRICRNKELRKGIENGKSKLKVSAEVSQPAA